MCLEKLYTEGFDIAAVYTKPDTPKNRGMKLIASEVKTYAQSVGLPVYQPETFRDDAVVEELKGLAPTSSSLWPMEKSFPSGCWTFRSSAASTCTQVFCRNFAARGLCSGRFSITATRRA